MNRDLVNTALIAIGNAIRDLRQPTGVATWVSEFGERKEDTYSTKTEADRLVVTEDLIGAAFVLMQTYLNGLHQHHPEWCNIHHVANYWKHRDGWNKTWTSNKPIEKKTIAAVKKLGAAPPVQPGQLTALAEKVLNGPFNVDALWTAITFKPPTP